MPMKGFTELLLIIALVVLLAAGFAWRIIGVDDCMESGGTPVGPMTRTQHCVGQ